jgi:ligand-binding SRPBCC domain-containing protein
MVSFRYSSLIDAPLEQVWEFHERPDILQLLTPPWQPVEVLRREGGLGIGAISEFRLWLGFIPINWLARHTECQPYQYFIDTQVQGPMQSWVHRHQFSSEGEKTRLTDSIEYEILKGTPLEYWLGLWVNSRLEEMFRYRHQVTQKFTQSSPT